MASAASSRNPKDTYALKQKAMKYYNENGVPSKMEEILNVMFYDDPPDVYGYLANYFSQFTKPATLSKICAKQVFGSSGFPTIQTNVFCTVNNKEKLLVSTKIPCANLKVKLEQREKAEVDRQESVLAAVKEINCEISKALSGMDPRQQAEVDEILLSAMDKLKELDEEARKKLDEEKIEAASPDQPEEKDSKKKSAKGKASKASLSANVIPDRPLENFASGCEAAVATSQAVCACAAVANNIPLYRHISNLARTKGALNEFRIPLPMVTIIQSGRNVPGKVCCVKDYMVVPGIAMPIDKSIEHIHHIFQYVAKSFAAKSGHAAKFVNESGALCPQLDTPTQGLDLLQEAVNAQGLTIGEDIYLAINAGGHSFFDSEKGRYEVTTGSFKTADEMVDFWTDISQKYPALIAIIDPIRGEDLQQWGELAERVSQSMYIIGDRFLERPGLLVKNPPTTPSLTSGAVLYLEQMNTVSDTIKAAKILNGLDNEIVVSTNQDDTADTFIVDFAVGVNARFFKVGGPTRGERSSKLNRLAHILNELEPPVSTPIEEGEINESTEKDVSSEQLYSEQIKEEEEESDREMGIKIDVPHEDGEDSTARSEKPMKTPEQQPEKGSELDTSKSAVWGAEEPSRLKLHEPFVFPLIEVPPPPSETDREGGTEADQQSVAK